METDWIQYNNIIVQRRLSIASAYTPLPSREYNQVGRSTTKPRLREDRPVKGSST